MYDDEPPYDRPDETRPVLHDRPSETPGLAIAVALVVAVLAALGTWYWLKHRPAAPPPQAAAAAPRQEPAAAPPKPERTLPALDASDAVVREMVTTLSASPRLAVWLANDDLVRRFVASVLSVAEGTSPRNSLRFLTPSEPFAVRRSGGAMVADSASFHRYDTIATVFVSLDTAGTAESYRRLHPLFDDAYREVGNPNESFDDALARAVGRLLAVPVPTAPLAVVPQGVGWAWADHDLEQRTIAEKHLLRMGPDNERRVQAKLRELAGAIGITPR